MLHESRVRVTGGRRCADEDWANLDWSKAPAIQEMPVTSAILVPAPDSTIPIGEDTVTVKGYAVAGGGREIVRVDVSADGGKTWQAATLSKKPEVPYRQHWAWTHWEVSCYLS
jgi:sulfite oxidase